MARADGHSHVSEVHPGRSDGLDGVVAAATALSEVDGERGELVIAGYDVADLAEHATFEETTWLLWHGDLPAAGELDHFRARLAAARSLPSPATALLEQCADRGMPPMDALRVCAGTLSLVSDEPEPIVAALPTIVASYARLLRRQAPVAPRQDLGHAANFLS